MADFDWKGLLKTVAPGIASVFGTPIAGLGVSKLLDVLLPAGAPQPEDPEAYIKEALKTATPDVLMKIKAQEQQFQLDVKRLEIDLAKVNQQNTDGARALKMEWLKTGKWDYEPILAMSVVGSFFYAEYWIFHNLTSVQAMSVNAAVLIGRLLGMIDSAFMLLLSFRWGTSKSSERKTEIMDKMNTNGNGKH